MDISFLFKIAAIGLIVAVLNQMLSKAGREEYATLTVLTGIVVIIAMLIPQVSSLFSDIKYIFNL
ncbi:MAG: stage III sporulation protein AC [Oscillospiraceae bacterium]|nr:stage III sporulation protein AC [Oscillospiraceae bacterium]